MDNFKRLLLLSLSLNVVGIGIYYGAERSINITSRLINYFGFETTLLCGKDSNLLYHSANDTKFSLHGVFEKNIENYDFSRMILDDMDVRESLKEQARNTSGVRIRFRTNSNYLSLRYTGLVRPGYSFPHHSEYGASGIDVHVNNAYVKTLLASDCGTSTKLMNQNNKQFLDIELFLPNFSKSRIIDIGLEKGALFEAPKEYNSSIVFYGTSITQGSGASRSSLSYPAIISRRLNSDFYNFGFSGNARGDKEIAEIISEIDADLIFLEFSRQAKSINGGVGDRLKMFCRIIRRKKPLIPIVVVGSFFDTSEIKEDVDLKMRSEEFKKAYLEMKKNDAAIYFLDGHDLLGENDLDGLVDGTHPNALGVSFIADRTVPFLRTLLPR